MYYSTKTDSYATGFYLNGVVLPHNTLYNLRFRYIIHHDPLLLFKLASFFPLSYNLLAFKNFHCQFKRYYKYMKVIFRCLFRMFNHKHASGL